MARKSPMARKVGWKRWCTAVASSIWNGRSDLVPSRTYSWERVRVRLIRFFASRSTFEITLTPALSHEYVGEGVRPLLRLYDNRPRRNRFMRVGGAFHLKRERHRLGGLAVLHGDL